MSNTLFKATTAYISASNDAGAALAVQFFNEMNEWPVMS